MREILAAFIAAIATILSAYMLYISSDIEAELELNKILFEQVNELREKDRVLTAKVTSLEIALSKKNRTAGEAIKEYIDSMPFPAWIKTVAFSNGGEAVFTIWYINEEYERTFGVKLRRYEGLTDFEVWPPKVAEEFYKNDLAILESYGATCVEEMFPKKALDPVSEENPLVLGLVCKWATEVGGKPAIAGQILELD